MADMSSSELNARQGRVSSNSATWARDIGSILLLVVMLSVGIWLAVLAAPGH